MRNLLLSIPLLVLLVNTTATVYAAEVCNAGSPGENSAQVLLRLPEALAKCKPLAAAVLVVGMNDAVNEKRFLTPEQTRVAVVHMLRLITDAHAKAFVVTVHDPDEVRLLQRHSPESFGGWKPARRINATNRALRKAAKQGGADIIDFHRALADAGGASVSLSTDGVHLTRTGYGLLANTVAAALPRGLDESKVLCIGDSLTYGIGVRLVDAADAGSSSYPQQLMKLLSRGL